MFTPTAVVVILLCFPLKQADKLAINHTIHYGDEGKKRARIFAF
jgi:hypothetical protein